MGREARVLAEVGGVSAEIKAELESVELILRGAIKRRFAKTSLENVRVEGEALRFESAGEPVALQLGEKAARSWADAIAKPPPSLRSKLGLGEGAKVLLVGPCDDAELAAALEGSLVAEPGLADMLIARIDDPDGLAAACTAHAACPKAPVWAVYPKGKGVAFGDGAIRTALRAAGFRDTKSCAVSERLTATRYHPA